MKCMIKDRILLMYFLLIPYLKPYNVTLIPTLDNIFKVWKIVATAIILISFCIGKKVVHKETIYMLLFLCVWSMSLIFNKTGSGALFNNILSIGGMLFYFETNYSDKRFRRLIIIVLRNISCVYIIMNFVTVLMKRPFFTKGMVLGDNANFLGGDNYSAFILIVMCGFIFFFDISYYQRIRLKAWIYAVIGFSCLLFTFALTGLIAYLFFILSVLLWNNTKTRGIIKHISNYKVAVIFCLTVMLMISYLNVDVFLSKILGKIEKVGFDGRNMIWPLTISAILKKPVLGYGGIDTDLAGTWIIAGANHAHNFILELPLSTGLLGTLFFALYFLQLLKGIKHNKKNDILLICLASYVICGTFDFYIGLIWMYILLNMIWIYKFDDKYTK